jgi:hypothetical protein
MWFGTVCMCMQLCSFILAASSLVIAGLAGGNPPVDSAHQMDFWVGSWKCAGETHGPNGKTTPSVAENVITKEYGGHVIHEHFKMKGFNGASMSVYNVSRKIWEQTWVDDSGSYLALSGGFADGKMSLAMAPDSAGRVKRMVFSNISHEKFDWDWQGSKDGKTWNTLWHLHYTRVGK